MCAPRVWSRSAMTRKIHGYSTRQYFAGPKPSIKSARTSDYDWQWRKRGLPLAKHPSVPQLAVYDTKNVHRNHRLRTPTGVTAVNHHQIAFCDDHSCLVTKSRSQLAN